MLSSIELLEKEDALIEAAPDWCDKAALRDFFHDVLESSEQETLDVEEILAEHEDRYMGFFDSGEEYAQDLYNGTGEVPDALEAYIDWRLVWNDLEMDLVWTPRRGAWGMHVWRCY